MTSKIPQSRPNHPARPGAAPRTGAGAFTLIELLTVIAIIALVTTITVPAIRSLGKSNDLTQATNLVRAMITNARAIAIAQHRPAGVVFFEETGTYAQPVHGGRTAMQLFVEAFDQTTVAPPAGATRYAYSNSARQYLPDGVRLASLTDVSDFTHKNVEAGDTGGARVILFDAQGELVLRDRLWTDPTPGAKGSYPMAYGDWKFDGTPNARSYPGFFLYNKTEFEAQPTSPPDARVNWLKKNSKAVIVNGNTGGILK
jgi:prepilin-type N-terminal cleavage/methylation domain-containing protein